MSRQRIRAGVLEGSTVVCAHCQGAGVVRSTASIALHVLRALEDALIKSSTHDVVVRTRTAVALYILNQKRANLRDLERRFGIAITIELDDTLTGANYHAIERGEIASGVKGSAEPPPLARDDFATIVDEPALFEEGMEDSEPIADEAEVTEGHRIREGGGQTDEGEVVRRRRRRRRRRGERPFGESIAPDAPQPTDDGLAAVAEIGGDLESAIESVDSVDRRGSRSEGGRNGRRSRRSRGLRNQYPAQDEGARETNVSEPLKPTDPEFDLRASSAPESISTDETEEYSAAAQPPTMEGPEVQDWRQDPRSPAAAPAEPSATVQEVPQGSPTAEPLAEPGPEPTPTAQEPPRPRRSGWWQRARASIVGD